jgi:hypothetical protein
MARELLQWLLVPQKKVLWFYGFMVNCKKLGPRPSYPSSPFANNGNEPMMKVTLLQKLGDTIRYGTNNRIRIPRLRECFCVGWVK